MIDPGHGGTDSGAVQGKAREADIALRVAEILKGLLAQDKEFSASMTRSTDQNLSLQDRVKMADQAKSDLLLSIHANAASDRRARGVELYFQNHLPPDEETLYLAANEDRVNTEEQTPANLEPSKRNDVSAILEDLNRQYRIKASHKLSRNLLASWNKSSKVETNAIRQAPFYVVSKAHMPSVLVELGFITNPKEAERLIDPAFQKEVAGRIYQGLKRYKENVDKVATSPLQ
jgi:N-acetylmuramoyl-L-alanine amidase